MILELTVKIMLQRKMMCKYEQKDFQRKTNREGNFEKVYNGAGKFVICLLLGSI